MPAPANIPLTLTFPYAAPNGVQVTVRRIPVTAGDAILGAPLNVDPVLSYAGSTVTITLPAVADGDAFTVIVSPRP